MRTYEISKPDRTLRGRIRLPGSKSIANRALIIRALSAEPVELHRLAASQDTQTLKSLLDTDPIVYDCGPAGTTFRFLTAYLALRPNVQVLTGSARMLRRPIGPLVEALRDLGAEIDYLEEEGYPPLSIGEARALRGGNLTIAADTSSQFISALLLIAPLLDRGLSLRLAGTVVSRPYIQMTLDLMAHFGVQHRWKDNTIKIAPQDYAGGALTVEADWSAASYYYSMAALADEVDLELEGLFERSVQGDQAIVGIMHGLGVETTYTERGVRLTKADGQRRRLLERDFLDCPDLAQTVAVTCAGTGTMGLFSGLETLKIKETDRIAALKQELQRVGTYFYKAPPKMSKRQDRTYYIAEGKADWSEPPRFATYEDHRMAMALAPLALLGPVRIDEPDVVGKSYPDFWTDLRTLGFGIKEA